MNPPDYTEESGPPATTSGAPEEGRPRTAHSSQSEIPDATGSQQEEIAPHPSAIPAPQEPVPTESQSTGPESSSEGSPSDEAIATLTKPAGSDTIEQATDVPHVRQTSSADQARPGVVDNIVAKSSVVKPPEEVAPTKTPAEEPHNLQPIHTKLEPKWKQHISYLVTIALTIAWVAVTVGYAAFFSLPHSQNSIILVTLFANLTVFFLVQCFGGVCDKLRWTLAVRESGVDLLTFLSLSGGTTPAGLVRLFFNRKRTWRCGLWCLGRVGFGGFQLALAVVLLFNPSVQPVPLRNAPKVAVTSGMPPFNASLVTESFADDLATTALVLIGGLLKDETVAFPSTSQNCTTAQGCYSYILPGSLSDILENGTSLIYNPSPSSAYFVTEAAPAYILEYFPLDDQVIFTQSTDCKVYGIVSGGIKLCLKNIGESLVAGWAGCPPIFTDTDEAYSCGLNQALWGNTMNLTIQLTVSSVLPDVNYHVQDGLINSVTQTLPITFNYSAEAIFYVFAKMLDTGDQANDTTTQLVQYLSTALAQDSPLTSQDVGFIFRNFLALPLYVSNARQITPTDVQIDLLPSNMTVMGYTANDDFRIVFSLWAIVTFIAIVGLTLLFCCIALLYCWCWSERLAPNVSDFPEIDFASKALSVSTEEGAKSEMTTILGGLGNAQTCDVIKRIGGEWIMVGDKEGRVAMILKSESTMKLEKLQKNVRY